MKEIGGYLEFEKTQGREYYPGLVKYNLGRTACVYYLKSTGCSRLYVPHFLCDSLTDAVQAAGITLVRYSIGRDFRPDRSTLPAGPLSENERLFILNPYGQLKNEEIDSWKKEYFNIFVDNTHAFFQRPSGNVPTLYSVRKFFGVSDGAYLASDRELPSVSERDRSNTRFSHILGRFEEDAGTYYRQMLDNAHSYTSSSVKSMSRLTENILGGLDYEAIEEKRLKNYLFLDTAFGAENPLENFLRIPDGGPFAYPLYIENGIMIRKALAKEKIFVPTYWNCVIKDCLPDSTEYRYAANILALPIDQRYDTQDMETVAAALRRLI